jgi:glycogen phosphorylase
MPSIAYLCLELALNNSIKSYSGGLGILAGDTIKSYADLGLDAVAVTLLYKNGYFKQSIDPITGKQIESNDEWDYKSLLTNTGKTFVIEIEHRPVTVQIWQYEYTGQKGNNIKIYFLDTNLDHNNSEDQAICYNLYSKYPVTRLKQEILIGIGSIKALETLGYPIFDKYHLNESHACFAIPYLQSILGSKQEAQKHIVFTTHTPLEHGHKKYTFEELEKQLTQKSNDQSLVEILKSNYDDQTQINVTRYCLENSSYSNAVSRKHAEVMHKMFPSSTIDYVTNGIHTYTWVSNSLAEVFDKNLIDWRLDSSILRNALQLTDFDIRTAHQKNKQILCDKILEISGKQYSTSKFTIGFARRVDSYKRQNFIFKDLDRLEKIAQKFGGIQFVFAGKAYPDTAGEDSTLAQIVKLSQQADLNINIVYIPNYDMVTSEFMVSGVDIWLNNPLRPLEASGTSGMKAALNGVPNFSVVDGWWVEGWQENETGWSIGDEYNHIGNEAYELNELYGKLEHIILPTYYYDTKKWLEIMKQAIALNGSHFNTQRMVLEYLSKAYIK